MASAPTIRDELHRASLPPGKISADLYRHLDRLLATAFPADVQAAIRASPRDEVSIQPIYDNSVNSYAADRVALVGDAGAALVELGRRIGRDQVERTPPWAALGVNDIAAWTTATLARERLFFYGVVAG